MAIGLDCKKCRVDVDFDKNWSGRIDTRRGYDAYLKARLKAWEDLMYHIEFEHTEEERALAMTDRLQKVNEKSEGLDTSALFEEVFE